MLYVINFPDIKLSQVLGTSMGCMECGTLRTGCFTYIWRRFVVIPIGIICQWRFINPMKFIFSITIMKPDPKWCILKLTYIMVFGKSSKIHSSQRVGSTNVFSTSNEIGNELIRFAVLDNSQWPSKLLTFDSGFGPRSNIFWKHKTIWSPFSTTGSAPERGILKSNRLEKG